MTTVDSPWDAWTYPPGAGNPFDAGIDITGYVVQAIDRDFGTVTEAEFGPPPATSSRRPADGFCPPR